MKPGSERTPIADEKITLEHVLVEMRRRAARNPKKYTRVGKLAFIDGALSILKADHPSYPPLPPHLEHLRNIGRGWARTQATGQYDDGIRANK